MFNYTFYMANSDRLTGIIRYFDYNEDEITIDLVIETAIGNLELPDYKLASGEIEEYLSKLGLDYFNMTVKPMEIGQHVSKDDIQDYIDLLTPFVSVDSYSISYSLYNQQMMIGFVISEREDNDFMKWARPA